MLVHRCDRCCVYKKEIQPCRKKYRGIWAILMHKMMFPSESCNSVSNGTFCEFRPFSVIADIFSPRTPCLGTDGLIEPRNKSSHHFFELFQKTSVCEKHTAHTHTHTLTRTHTRTHARTHTHTHTHAHTHTPVDCTHTHTLVNCTAFAVSVHTYTHCNTYTWGDWEYGENVCVCVCVCVYLC